MPTDPCPQPQTAGEEIEDQVVRLLPWGVSILAHAAVILLAVFVVWSVKVIEQEPDALIPTADFNPQVHKPLDARPHESRTRKPTTSPTANPNTSPVRTTIHNPTNTHVQLHGISGQTGGGPFGDLVRQTDPFAAPGIFGTFPTPRSQGFRSVVFVVDASGSLIDTLPFVLDELRRSVRQLSPRQKFTVIFFQGNDVIEAPYPHRGLKDAAEETKLRTIQWTNPAQGNIRAQGHTNPLKAIELALRYQPDLVFLLSDNITGSGVYQIDQKELLAAIERTNIAGTIICTIQLIYPDPLTQYGLEPTMQRISRAHGGNYKFVDGRELGY